MANFIANLFSKKDNRYKLILIWATICLVLDQLTKLIVVNTLHVYEIVPVIPGFFNLVHYKNFGAAFGFLNNSQTDWQFYFFALAMVAAVVMVYHLAKTSSYNKILFIALGLLLGGALGNFVDRFISRSVTDFLDFYIGSIHWPAFNIADMGISIGAALAIIILFKVK